MILLQAMSRYFNVCRKRFNALFVTPTNKGWFSLKPVYSFSPLNRPQNLSPNSFVIFLAVQGSNRIAFNKGKETSQSLRVFIFFYFAHSFHRSQRITNDDETNKTCKQHHQLTILLNHRSFVWASLKERMFHLPPKVCIWL